MTGPCLAWTMDDAQAEPELTPPHRHTATRRVSLVLAGLVLVAAGGVLNAERLGFAESQTFEPVAAYASESEQDAGGEGARHLGQEGKMGQPSPARSKLYAMKGPKDGRPQDQMEAARSPGILGQTQSGHFLASPNAEAFTRGNNDQDVWGGLSGTAIGEAFGAGGLGLVGKGRGAGGLGEGIVHNPFVHAAKDGKSTFSIDVDTAAYASVRHELVESGRLPQPAMVRTEELINYFSYDYPQPQASAPFSVTAEVGAAPWNAEHRLVHIGLQGKVLQPGKTPRRNLVYLLDVSGSMSSANKLPLITAGLTALTNQLGPKDRISIVAYAGAAGVVLPPTRGDQHQIIAQALGRLQAGGSTDGGQGIKLAYKLAKKHFVRGGVNRVIIGTDGDFNVGVVGHDALVELIEAERKTGVYLSVLGVGGVHNDHMMEQIADKGNGNYAYLDSALEARKVLVEEAGAMLDTIAKDVKIQVEFDPAVVKEHRLIGYENRVMAHREFNDDTKDAGEIGAGHTVTAIYEVVVKPNVVNRDLMQLNLRYKRPSGSQSSLLQYSVADRVAELSETSQNYRFSAAVATFGQKLRGAEVESKVTYGEILTLAQGATGEDPHCYRREFVNLVWRAGVLSGENVARPELEVCVPSSRPPQYVEVEAPGLEALNETEGEPRAVPSVSVEEEQDDRDTDWKAFVVEVLRLLPPLLALPLFVMAFRRRR